MFYYAILLPPLLAWIVLLCAAATRTYPQVQTGDELFDRWAELIAESMFNSRQGDDWLAGIYTNCSELERDGVLGWEQEFGDDPRYWMLRYNLGITGPAKDAEYEGNWELKWDEKPLLLENARRLGAADAAVLYQLLNRQELDETCDLDNNSLIQELLEAGADYSAVHYKLAVLESQRGNLDRAFEYVANGNRAPHSSFLSGFPFDRTLQLAKDGAALPEKAVLARMCTDTVSAPLPNYIGLKRMLKLLIDDAVARRDMQALNDLNILASRLGLADDSVIISALVAAMYMQLIYNAVVSEINPPRVIGSRDPLNEFAQELATVSANIRQRSRQSVLTPMQMSAWQQVKFYAKDCLTQGQSSAAWYLQTLGLNEVLAEQQYMAGPVRAQLEKLAAFDYTIMDWREQAENENSSEAAQ